MKIYKRYFFLPIWLIIIHPTAFAQFVPYADTSTMPDYSQLKHWAAHPWKYDLSDSTPTALLSQPLIKDSVTDVFFIHPTTYTKNSFTRWNASLEDETLNEKTDQTSILYQASAFNESSRVFAPRYRQAHLQAFYIDQATAAPYFDTAYADIKLAFEYYLQHYNNGRPVIIAAHSQGTVHAARLLKEFFENKPLYNRLICAYLIGMPVPVNYFETLRPCNNENATGCFISWRTYKKGYVPSHVKAEKDTMLVVNPLTWTTDENPASSNLNKGAVLKNFNKVVRKAVSAQVKGNILWSSKPNVPFKFLFFKKNYHIGDINLFYVNIRENVKKRIAAFWKR